MMKTYRFKEIAEVVNGATPSSSNPDFYDGDVVWFTPKDLSDQKSKYVERGERNITQEGYDSCSAKLIPAYNILMSSRAPIGLLAINVSPCCTNQGFKSFIVNKEICDVDYLYYYLIHHMPEIERLGSGTTFKEVSKATIENFTVILPSLEEQKKTIKLLYLLDRKIALNREINQNLEALAKQLYDYWFVQFDFPNEEGKPYKSSGGKMVWNEKLKREIPEGWEVEKIDCILDKVISTPRLVTNEYLKYGEYAVIDQTTDVYYAGFTNRNDAVVRQFPAVIFGDHSCAVKYVNFPFVRGADGTQVMLSNNINVSVEYLYFVVKNVRIGKGYARHYGFLKEQPIIIPSYMIARRFEDYAKNIFNKITKNRKENLLLTKQRDELLPLLMNGQVSIQNQ